MKSKICSLLLVFFSSVSFADVTIQITRGYDAAIPIAVVPFKDAASNAPMDVADVVNSDLYMSGQFNTFDAARFTQVPHDSASANMSYFRQMGAENAVVGQIRPVGNNRYDVQFELIDIFKKNNPGMATSGNTVLLAKSFVGVEGKDLRRLAHHISDLVYERILGVRGAFSTRLAYISVDRNGKNPAYALEVSDVDGYNAQKVVMSREPLMSPSWSPDGRKLAYVSFETHRAEVYVVDLATGQRERITRFPGINGAPAWSPDGSKLAVTLSKDGTPKIYVVELATRTLRRVTDGVAIDTEPCWTNDGQNIVFTSSRGGKPQIYQVNLASGNVQRLTFQGDYNARATLTPDGRKMVLIHLTGNGYNIALKDLQSDNVTLLSRSTLDESPTVSPNGAMVLYGTQEGTRGVLGAVSIDGRVRLRLPARSGSVQEPAWSPFLS